jgi:short-subunit dehydrogenase
MNGSTVRKALITGASSGLGAEFARQLAAGGSHLLLVARRKERLETLAEDLRKRHSISVEIHTADLSQTEELERIESVITGTSDLDLLVNNAGFGGKGTFIDGDIEGPLNMIRVQVVAPVRLTRAVVGGMIDRNRGGVINVASLAAFSPLSGVTYAATKGYLVRFSQGLQLELAGTDVRVQALCPGFTHTEFHAKMAEFKASIPRFMWLSAERVVRTSLRALGRKRVICVPGGWNRFLAAWMRCPLTYALTVQLSKLPYFRKKTEN